MKKTKFITALMAGTMLTGIAASSALAVDVYLDDSKVNFTEATPYITNGRTMVPLRPIFESLGWTVEWHSDSSTAMITKANDTEISVPVGNRIGYYKYNGTDYANYGGIIITDVNVVNNNGTLMLPLRAISELIGKGVIWNESTDRVDLINGQSDNAFIDTDLINFMVSLEGTNSTYYMYDYDGDGKMEVIAQGNNRFDDNGKFMSLNENELADTVFAKDNNGNVVKVLETIEGTNEYENIENLIANSTVANSIDENTNNNDEIELVPCPPNQYSASFALTSENAQKLIKQRYNDDAELSTSGSTLYFFESATNNYTVDRWSTNSSLDSIKIEVNPKEGNNVNNDSNNDVKVNNAMLDKEKYIGKYFVSISPGTGQSWAGHELNITSINDTTVCFDYQHPKVGRAVTYKSNLATFINDNTAVATGRAVLGDASQDNDYSDVNYTLTFEGNIITINVDNVKWDNNKSYTFNINTDLAN